MMLRVLHFSPSTATGRHDSFRAALGFVAFLQAAVAEIRQGIDVELVWALPSITSKSGVHALLADADLTVIATPTYAQGSPWFLRRFLELGAGLQLWGRLGTAFASAGGQHTGGEVAVADTLRSMMGMGMATFTFSQKLVVFGAQQKFSADGTFDVIDTWFLRQLARTCVAHLAGRVQPGGTEECVRRWQLDTGYYNAFPEAKILQSELGELTDRLNALLHHPQGYEEWSRELGFDCRPPNARELSFFDLLPVPGVAKSEIGKSQGNSLR